MRPRRPGRDDLGSGRVLEGDLNRSLHLGKAMRGPAPLPATLGPVGRRDSQVSAFPAEVDDKDRENQKDHVKVLSEAVHQACAVASGRNEEVHPEHLEEFDMADQNMSVPDNVADTVDEAVEDVRIYVPLPREAHRLSCESKSSGDYSLNLNMSPMGSPPEVSPQEVPGWSYPASGTSSVVVEAAEPTPRQVVEPDPALSVPVPSAVSAPVPRPKVSDLRSMWEKRSGVASPATSKTFQTSGARSSSCSNAPVCDSVSRVPGVSRKSSCWLRCASDSLRRQRREERANTNRLLSRLLSRAEHADSPLGCSSNESAESGTPSESASPGAVLLDEIRRTVDAESRAKRRVAAAAIRVLSLDGASDVKDCPQCHALINVGAGVPVDARWTNEIHCKSREAKQPSSRCGEADAFDMLTSTCGTDRSEPAREPLPRCEVNLGNVSDLSLSAMSIVAEEPTPPRSARCISSPVGSKWRR